MKFETCDSKPEGYMFNTLASVTMPIDQLTSFASVTSLEEYLYFVTQQKSEFLQQTKHYKDTTFQKLYVSLGFSWLAIPPGKCKE